MSSVRDRIPGAKRRRRAGYTLIEVLVATAVFSALALLAGMALSQGLRQYQGLVDRGLNFWGHAHRIWTDKSFHSMVDYTVCSPSNKWFPYFQGGQEALSYVTLAPLAGDAPVVAWIMKETSAAGKCDLVYYEVPVYARGYPEIEALFSSGSYRSGRSVKLLEGADWIRFRYFGYDDRVNRHLWSDTFDGRSAGNLPMFVQIDCGRGGREEKFMFGVHVNSTRKKEYQATYGQ